MSISAVDSGSRVDYCIEPAKKEEKSDAVFSLDGIAEDVGEELQSDEEINRLPGNTFAEVMMYAEKYGNKIPVVNQIVSAKNPKDGAIYLTFFTDNEITCDDATGRRVWELTIDNEQQAEKVKNYFENFKPDREFVREYYSDKNMGIVSSRDFWLELFRDSEDK